MAAYLGDSVAATYATAAERAVAAIEARLFTGEYYRQAIDDVDARRYQYGAGVLSDQLLGQSLAHVVGLGHLLPADHVRRAILAVHRHNFRRDLSEHESTQRTYALNDEGGLLLASWPYGGRPRIPFIYSDEVWTGIEYQVAAHLAYEGFVDEALEIVRTTRTRFDGVRRNPWNEAECGNHYARSMASWSLLLAFSGAQWDASTRSLAFAPAESGAFSSFFSTAHGWGQVTVWGDELTLSLDFGTLQIDRLFLRGRACDLPAGGLSLSAGDRVTLSPPTEGTP